MVVVKTKESPYRVQVLDRTLGILEVLSSDGPELTLADLSDRLALHKSTVHRLVMVLERHRFVEKNPKTGKYRLGLKLFELGSKAVSHFDLRERARPHLERLVFETGETVHLCILDEGEVLYMEKVEPSRSVRMASHVGRRNAAHCTGVGKVLMAFLPENELNALIKKLGLRAYTPNTITDPTKLKSELQLVRQRGYAIDSEENEEGVRCIGAPVREYSGTVVASVSISGPSFRLTGDKIPSLARSVVSAANRLSEELGYKAPAAAKAVGAAPVKTGA